MSSQEQSAPTKHSMIRLSDSFGTLPSHFYARQNPIPVSDPKLIAINHDLAAKLGIETDKMSPIELAEVFSGNRIIPDTSPLCMVYGGHQFGNWVPQLGDGRAHLLGDTIDPHGKRHDVQLKGSGRTVFSRGGDGRAWLGPVLREFLVSEAMHALGIPTTRSLCAVATGESVYRETALPGAILTRTARCHIRIGTFQYFLARDDREGIRLLLRYSIQRLCPELLGEENPALEFLRKVASNQASLIANWMAVGFIHGVMNTDNMSVAAETIDFGPCAFLDEYKLDKVFSSIDVNGRYAYGNQPAICQWNLMHLANALLPVIHTDSNQAVKLAEDVLNSFIDLYKSQWRRKLLAKFGIAKYQEGDSILCDRFLKLLESQSVDFTLAFRRLAKCVEEKSDCEEFCDLFTEKVEINEWIKSWSSRLRNGNLSPKDCTELMRQVNPVIIPRNHQIERAIEYAVEGNFQYFHRLWEAVLLPFGEKPVFSEFARAPIANERVLQTFCGT